MRATWKENGNLAVIRLSSQFLRLKSCEWHSWLLRCLKWFCVIYRLFGCIDAIANGSSRGIMTLGSRHQAHLCKLSLLQLWLKELLAWLHLLVDLLLFKDWALLRMLDSARPLDLLHHAWTLPMRRCSHLMIQIDGNLRWWLYGNFTNLDWCFIEASCFQIII